MLAEATGGVDWYFNGLLAAAQGRPLGDRSMQAPHRASCASMQTASTMHFTNTGSVPVTQAAIATVRRHKKLTPPLLTASIFVCTEAFFAKVQLTDRSIRTNGKPRHPWPTVTKVGRCLFIQSRRLFVLRQPAFERIARHGAEAAAVCEHVFRCL